MGISLRRYLLAKLSHREAGVSQQDWKWLKFSYSQYGEDIIADALLARPQGFYVDVGAYDPVVISNTYLLYRKGWRGIAVDPNPDVANRFAKKRPRDIVVQCAVSEEEGSATLNITESGPTTHVAGAGVESGGPGKLDRSITVRQRRLDGILKEHLPPGQGIDFLTVDCEGRDLEVLRSNDWEKYRPQVIAVEDFETDAESKICRFLLPLGYRQVLKTGMTRFFSR